MGSFWIPVLGVFLLLYVAFGLQVYLRQDRIIFVPDRTVEQTPDLMSLPFEAVTLHTQDQKTLAAWYIPCDDASPFMHGRDDRTGVPTVLFCHGNGGDMGDRLETISVFHEQGFNVFIFDYHGYGESSGVPTEANTFLDGEAAWNYLIEQKHIPANRLLVFGRSLGGAVASWIAEQKQPALLILESTFTSAPDMAASMFPFLPSRWVCKFHYDTLARMPHIHCPVLVAHSQQDQVVPFVQGQHLFSAARDPKCFVEIQGLHDAGGLDIDLSYQKRLLQFIQQYVLSEKTPRTSRSI